MNNEQLINSISAVIILLVIIAAIFILARGIRRKSVPQILIGAVLLSLMLVIIIEIFPGAGVTLSALSTIVVAVFAGLMLLENWRFRQEERERLALERIRGWAEEVCGLIMQPTSKAKTLPERLDELDLSVQSSVGRSLGTLRDAEQLGGDLNICVKRAHLTMMEFVSRLRGDEEVASYKNEYGIKDELKPIGSSEELLEAKRQFINTLSDVIESATKRLVPTG